MWNKPWKLAEGFLIGGGLIVVGLLLQITVGEIDWQAFAFPVNIILLVAYLFAVVGMYAARNRVYLFRFLGSYAAAVPALAYAVALTAIMGLTRQVPDGHPSVDPLGLSKMLSLWSFVLVYVWLSVIVAQATLHRLHHFRWRDIPFLLNHAGLLIVLLCATLGNADMRRLKMKIHISSPEWRATDANGRVYELPIAMQLKDFTIEEYPPKLMLVDAQTGEPRPKEKPLTLLVDSSFRSADLYGWHIHLNKRLEEAAPLMSRDTTNYLPWHSSGAVCAVNITATSSDGRQKKTGWVTCGSYHFPYQVLSLDGKVCIAMPEREPQRYVSTVEVMTKAGLHTLKKIEVNHPLNIEGWKIYQLSYDTQMGKWSETSVLELVYDPWLPFVYIGLGMMMLGAVCMFLSLQRRKTDSVIIPKANPETEKGAQE